MKPFAVLAVMVCAQSHAAFRPLSLEEKCIKSDIVIFGKVISVTKTIQQDEFQGRTYFGPRSIATVQVIESIHEANPKDSRWWSRSNPKPLPPSYIMVPCDYNFSESPSSLTKDIEYVMFLKSNGHNLYHPVDPASTHVVYKSRVRTFGMNHQPISDAEFEANSITLTEFINKIKENCAKKKKGPAATPQTAG